MFLKYPDTLLVLIINDLVSNVNLLFVFDMLWRSVVARLLQRYLEKTIELFYIWLMQGKMESHQTTTVTKRKGKKVELTSGESDDDMQKIKNSDKTKNSCDRKYRCKPQEYKFLLHQYCI